MHGFEEQLSLGDCPAEFNSLATQALIPTKYISWLCLHLLKIQTHIRKAPPIRFV